MHALCECFVLKHRPFRYHKILPPPWFIPFIPLATPVYLMPHQSNATHSQHTNQLSIHSDYKAQSGWIKRTKMHRLLAELQYVSYKNARSKWTGNILCSKRWNRGVFFLLSKQFFFSNPSRTSEE